MSDQMYKNAQSAGNALNTVKDSRPLTRIESDIEQIKSETNRLESIADRIASHARALGYFHPPSEGAKSAAPTPVVTTMSDAIQALDRAVDNCSGALNLFD